MQKIILILLCSVLISCKSGISINQSKHDFMSMDDYYLNKYQRTLDSYTKAGVISFEKEDFYTESLLLTEKEVVNYTTLIFLQKYPTIGKSLDIENIFIGKDKSSKVWFVRFNFPKLIHNNFYIMVMENNCKIIYFSKFME